MDRDQSWLSPRRIVWLAMAALVVAAVACATPLARETTLEVVNGTSQDLCAVYVSPADSDDWGDDRLGESTLAPGQQLTVADLEPGTYDLRAETCDGNAAERFDEQLEGETEWTITE